MDHGLQVVVEGIAFGESVRWHGDRVWFCDWVDGDVCSVEPEVGDLVTHAHVDGLPVCIDWDADGRLLVVNGSANQLLRAGDRGLEVVADLSGICDRPWNEVAAHPSGNVYVNGIGFDMVGGETPRHGQIALVTPDGGSRLVAEDLAFPNGMAIDRTGSVLVVAESHAARITAFTIDSSGSLSERRVFAAVPGSAPDGICFAVDGVTIWYADVPNQHCQRVAEGGKIQVTIELDRGCFACAVSPDSDVYIAATVWDDHTFSTRRGVLYRRPAPR